MRFDPPLTIPVGSVWLPPERDTLADAVARGCIDAEEATDLGYRELPVATVESAPDMAVRAGREVLTAAGSDGADVGLLVHAWSHYQGHDFWLPPHYVADRLGASAALPIGVQQMCNGGAAALQVAAAHLVADASMRRAIVVTADRFVEPGFRRWDGDYGMAYGDGAAALLLDREPGPGLELRCIATVAAPGFEAMHRGHDVAAPAARWTRGTVDVRRTKKVYLRQHGTADFVHREAEAIREVVRACLAEDGDVAVAVLPRLGRSLLESTYIPLLAELTSGRSLDLAAETGHLGAGDLIAGLADLNGPKDLLHDGQSALVLSVGAGFTWSCALVRAVGRS